MGLPNTTEVEMIFQVSVEWLVNPSPTQDEARDSFARVLAMPTDHINITIINVTSDDGRRLEQGSIVRAIGKTTNGATAKAASTASANPELLANALKAVSHDKFENVEVTTRTPPSTTAGLKIVQHAANESQAGTLAAAIDANLPNSHENISSVSTTVEIPTSVTTMMPPHMPTTVLKFKLLLKTTPTKDPTVAPAAIQTKTLTAMPTNEPTVPRTSSSEDEAESDDVDDDHTKSYRLWISVGVLSLGLGALCFFILFFTLRTQSSSKVVPISSKELTAAAWP